MQITDRPTSVKHPGQSMHSHGKRLYGGLLDRVDTCLLLLKSIDRLISLLVSSSKIKESKFVCYLKCNLPDFLSTVK